MGVLEQQENLMEEQNKQIITLKKKVKLNKLSKMQQKHTESTAYLKNIIQN